MCAGRGATGTVDLVEILVRTPADTDFDAWRELWDAYLVFYETELPADNTKDLWNRIRNPDSTIQCHLAELDGQVVGLVHFFAHEDTWHPELICYLQDLYVDEMLRGNGIGRMLIESVVEQATKNRWSAVYWLTADDNQQAKVLYDKLTGGTSGFIHYEIPTPRL